jgi:DNA polymerase-3 subunit delta
MELPYAKLAGKTPIEPIMRAYLFEGKEDAQKQEILAKLVGQLSDDGVEGFDVEVCEGQTLTSQRLFTAAGVPPFASQKRIVIVKRANTVPAAEQEIMAEKLSGLPESAVVVFIVSSPELKDGKPKAGSALSGKLAKAISKVGAVVSFAALRPDDAVREAARKITDAGKKIDAQAVRRLVDRVGNDLMILDSEIRKLIDYTGDRNSITVKDVELVTEQKSEERIWKLLDAIGARNTPLALRLLRETLDSGGTVDSEAPRLLAMILRQLRLVWQARALVDKGWRLQGAPDQAMDKLPSDNNVIVFCKRQSFQAPRLQEQARNFTLADLRQCFEYCAAADLSIKGIEGEIENPAITLELLVINLCRRKRGTT